MNQFEQAYQKMIMEKEMLQNVHQYVKHADTVDLLSRFKNIVSEMTDIYEKKNRDYGDSFNQSLDEDGLVVSKIRLGDKYKRFSRLVYNPAHVKGESIRDTLLDMANYSIMTVMWLDIVKEIEHVSKQTVSHAEAASTDLWVHDGGATITTLPDTSKMPKVGDGISDFIVKEINEQLKRSSKEINEQLKRSSRESGGGK